MQRKTYIKSFVCQRCISKETGCWHEALTVHFSIYGLGTVIDYHWWKLFPSKNSFNLSEQLVARSFHFQMSKTNHKCFWIQVSQKKTLSKTEISTLIKHVKTKPIPILFHVHKIYLKANVRLSAILDNRPFFFFFFIVSTGNGNWAHLQCSTVYLEIHYAHSSAFSIYQK